MRRSIQVALFALAAVTSLEAQETEIHLTDGSRIRGTMDGIGTDRVIFDAGFLARPVPLRLDKVLELSLPVHPDEGKGDHVATVTLSNGDILRGELTGIDDTSVTLDTWFAGRLTFRRSMVDTLEIQDRPEIIYSGPTGLEDWTQSSEESWTFENGALRSHGTGEIGRTLDLPARARFAFDLEWRSNPRFRFDFYDERNDSEEPENCYELTGQGRYVQLNKRTPRGNQSLGSTNIPEFMSKEKVRLEILADRKSGQIRLLVNDRVAADWIDPAPDAGKPGGGIHFSSPDSTPLRLSRIKVTTWDGVIEGSAPDRIDGMIDEDDAPQPEPVEPDVPGRVRLRNSDQVAGELLGIEDGKVKLKTPFGEVSLPVSRLRTFTLHTEEERDNWELGLYEIPKIYNGDVRAWFPDGGCVTFKLQGVTDGKLNGTAQPFGQASFDQKAFSRIEFNLYESEFDELRGEDNWR